MSSPLQQTMASSIPLYHVGDQVWVKTGISGEQEELATVLTTPTTPSSLPKRRRSKEDNNAAPSTNNNKLTVKYIVSGFEVNVGFDKVRLMNHDNFDAEVMDMKGRKVRRSGRSTSVPVMLMNVGAGGDDINSSAKKKFAANAAAAATKSSAAVTPSPASTEFEFLDEEEGSSYNGSSKEGVGSSDVTMEEEEDSKKPAAAATSQNKKRKSSNSAASKVPSKKKAKSAPSSKQEVDSSASGGIESVGKKGSSPYFAKGNNNNVKDGKKVSTQSVRKKAARGGKGRKLMLASSEEDDDDMVAGSKGKKKKAASNQKQSATDAVKKSKSAESKSAKKKQSKAVAKKKQSKAGVKKQSTASSSTDICLPCNDNNNNNNAPPPPAVQAPEGNVPDGNGGLNQPIPWIVEYSKTGRATCRSCDEKIVKGSVRVGHTPLFRGKPGFMVYRHLHCATFSEEINTAEDVENYETLNEEDYIRLSEQVEVSKERIKEEREELRPDELVQKSFTGQIRNEPQGLMATLLPFQVEGFSWMRHQEVMEEEIRGGILADEMGMGKTIQAIATILDNRPKLQHAKPGMKHPPTEDMKERQNEEELWDKAKVDWTNEMDVLKVSKKLRSRDGGARAGTLVICPIIALTQWKTEIEKFTEEGTLTVCTYHGPDRESQTPRQLMKKYDVVLTTYQVLEADFRKMTSPNRVECPNCGGKFKIDKLPIHLKYFCGDNAERTEAQARQVRNSERGGDGGGRRGRRPGGGGKKDDKKDTKKKQATKSKEKPKEDKKQAKKKKPAAKKPVKKKAGEKKSAPSEKPNETTPRTGSKRSAARKAASQISQSAEEWMPPDDDDSDNFRSDDESSGNDSSDNESDDGYSSDSSEDSALEKAREKQRQALEMANSKKKKKPLAKKKQPASKAKGKGNKASSKKPAAKGKGKPKKFDDESDEDYSSSDSTSGGLDDIDMAALVEKAMSGAKNSVLHSLCWWRIILDEAHFIKTRSSQTANAAFSLIGVNRWALSGTPLQNRVGEFYSLVRFLRLNPMAYYFCRSKECDCKSMHYRIHAGICEGCGHGGIQHYSHFNKYILNPIQRDGYSGDGRKAMFLLKNEVLDKALLRRTKETKAADMELPPRLVQIKPVRLHPVEEDFYSALYTQTKSSFDDYVDSGTLLNNYAHIFDLLIRMRQSVDHPYLVIHSKKNTDQRAALSQATNAAPEIANGSADCDLCHEPPTDRVVSTCCGAAYCRACVLEYMATSNSMAESASLSCPSCRAAFSIDLQASADIEDDAALNVVTKSSSGSAVGMPSLKELQHVATGSILRRINLSDFATSSKIEALTRELVTMRQTSPGSKAIVFSQFVNMLDLIRWRLHSDPYLEDIGLGCRALHGGMNVKARDACLKDFRENNNVRVLLMSLKAGGVALNLTCANYIFLMDPWWNPGKSAQAIDRTHRLGQYRPIRAVRFIAENTVEERILQLQEKKRLVFDGTVGRDAGSLKMLTVDDMKSLFA